MDPVESLQALVVRRAAEIGGREGPLSVRDLEERCGGKVSRGVFQRIMAGTYDAKVGQRVLDGLAIALDVDLRVIEASAGAPPSFGPFQLPDDAARLTPAQRKAVKHVVQVFIDGNEAQSADDGATVTPLRKVASGRPAKAQPERDARAEKRAREASAQNPDAPPRKRGS